MTTAPTDAAPTADPAPAPGSARSGPSFGRLALLAAVAVGGALVLAGGAALLMPRPPEETAMPAALPPAIMAPEEDSAAQLAALEAQVHADPTNPELGLELGARYAELNRIEEALLAFQQVERAHPELVEARVGQGQMWMRLRRPGRAVEAYEWAVRKLPENGPLRLELGGAYLNLRDLVSAQRELRKAVELMPNSDEARRAMATGYMATSSVTDALREATRATELGPGEAENWTMLGSVCLNSDRMPEARDALRKALALNPDNAAANVLLARVLNKIQEADDQGREEYALLTRALLFQPHNAEALHLLGRWYMDHDQLDLAVGTLRRAREMDPREPRVVQALGQALVRRGDVVEGRQLAELSHQLTGSTTDFRGLEYQAARNPNPNIHLRLAKLYMQHDYHDSAVHLLRRSLRMNPGNATLKAELALAEARANATLPAGLRR